MLQNIKVDVIYYKTHTDFEMEFNLCGCCRMRLLTDKVTDRKNLIHSMARAVSRSRVIIIVGSLFGEDGILKLSAGAIGTELSAVDSKTYGISDDGNIEILKGSTPLVTPEGYFGGCIIESGPQTMILVSDSKNVRKSVMQTLIHPYIEEIAALSVTEKRTASPITAPAEQAAPTMTTMTEMPETEIPVPSDEGETEETLTENTDETLADSDEETADFAEADSDTEQTDEEQTEENNSAEDEAENDTELSESATETEPITEEALEENAEPEVETSLEQPTAEEVTEPSSEPADTSENEEPFFTEEKPTDTVSLFEAAKPKESTKPDVSSLSDDEYSTFIGEEDYDDVFRRERSFNKPSSLNLSIAVIAVILLIGLAVLCYCLFYVPSKDGVTASAYIRETFEILFGR